MPGISKESLRLFSYGEVDMFASPEIVKDFFLADERGNEDVDQVKGTLEDILSNFWECDPMRSEVLKEYQRLLGFEGVGVLAAHGGTEKGTWLYTAGGRDFRVNDWIKEKDGDYSVLILFCCNLGSHKVNSKESAVLVPDRTYSRARMERGFVNVELFIPGRGYISDYTIDFELARLKGLPSRGT